MLGFTLYHIVYTKIYQSLTLYVCWECSTKVEQAETQLRVVVPIEEEEHCM
jgi:hypothetical protein